MYQCVDESGHKSFSNIKSSVKGAKCTAMDLGEPVAVPAPKAPAAKTPTPASFPKVDDSAQKARDTDRRRILEGELASEQKNLEDAKKTLAEQEAVVLPEERLQGGAIAGGKVLSLARVHDPAVRGFALGVAAHGIGTARAFQVSEQTGAFAALAMGLNGLLTALLLPAIAGWLVK